MKNMSLDHEDFASFRPISNLKLMSKAREKVVASQVNIYIKENNLNELYQSAYKKNHSTETAMVKVHNDILRALDNQSSVILLLLDLSAAFNTVDHQILLSRLKYRYGFNGKVLDWFSSYLSDRKQFVKVESGTYIFQSQSKLWTSSRLDFGSNAFLIVHIRACRPHSKT